ncbi:hypothetical protein LTR92_009622 [Exophiala xenobiotica]|nr:hypothetical protein LTR92_009622 [Exophiala xenobiotica]
MPVPSLPTEALYMIVRQLVGDLWVDAADEGQRRPVYSTLRNLRLTCKAFESMAVIKQELFRDLHLWATHEEVARLEQTDLSRIGGFVTTVNLYPSPYFAELKLKDYRDILVIQNTHLAEPAYATDYDLLRCQFPWRKHGHCQNHSQILGAEDQTAMEYDSYRRCADRDQALIKQERLQRIWTALMQGLGNLRECNLRPVVGLKLPLRAKVTEPTILSTSVCDAECQHFTTLTHAAAPSMDLLFKALLECLCLARPRLTSILFDGDFRETFTREWVDPWWDKLKLDHLTRLRFDSIPFNNVDGDEDRRDLAQNAETALAALLGKSHSTLENLTLDRFWEDVTRMTWQSISTLDFPQLRSLDLTNILVSPRLLAEDLKCLPRLKELLMDDCLTDEDGTTWKPFFDSIRQHPNELRLDLEKVGRVSGPFEDEKLFSFDFGTEGHRQDQLRCPLPIAVDKDLTLYLSNRGHWSQILEAFFADFRDED